MTKQNFSRRIFSGIQPTGNLHLGNYLGAIKNWCQLQHQFASIYCVVDLHAITVPQNPDQLTAATREVAASLLAAGIDPKTSIIFNQSRVTQHTELAWILTCLTRIGWLNRMTQFKEKAGKNRDNATLGLFSYPVLMAADILAYKATHVPVGEDQKQHLELTRDIAAGFNAMVGEEFFPLPEPQILGQATRVMSLRDGTAKMSKSDPSDFSRINLSDDADAIAHKIRKAKTDSDPLPDNPKDLDGRDEARNLVTIYAALADETIEKTLAHFAGQGFSVFKPALIDLAVARLAPVTKTMRDLARDSGHIDAVLEDGAERAYAIALPIINEVRQRIGLLGKTLG